MSDVINKLNGYIIQDARVDNLATVATSGDYDDLSNKPTIPSLTGYATTTYVDDAVGAVVVPDISGLATEQYVDDAVAAIDIPDVSGFVESSDLATVATSGSYNDLTDKPVIPAAPDLSSYATKSELSAKANAADLATVATSGSYNDLSNKPTIPSTSGLASETYVDNAIAAIDIPDVSGFVEAGDLASVATSGDYDDLTNKPTIPSVSGLATETYVDNAVAAITVPDDAGDIGYDNTISGLTADDVQEAIDEVYAAIPDVSGYAVAANLSTVATSGDYDDLTNKPTIPSLSGYATETWVGQQGYLTSHQDISGKANIADLATVATTGDYDDLINKPTIPVLPTLATVATSGSYNDLSNKPTIPISGNSLLIPLVEAISKLETGILKDMAKVCSSKEQAISYLQQGYPVIKENTSGTISISYSELGLNNGYTIHFSLNNSSIANVSYDSSGLLIGKNRINIHLFDNVYMEIMSSSLNNINAVITNVVKQILLSYSNTTSGLTATTIQDAIDELAASAGGSEVGWAYDSSTGYMTFTGMSDNNM